MGIYLPYETMPEDRIDCPLNFGGMCLITPTFNSSDKPLSKECVGIDCGRIKPMPNRINGIKIKDIKD